MKTTFITALAALVCGSFVPVYAAGPALDAAVRAASRASQSSLSTICKATYDAVRETPDEADTIFEAVLAQRADWKASEVYAIFRSVLLARPDLTAEVGTLVANHSKNGKNGNDGSDASKDENDEESSGSHANGGRANGDAANDAELVGAVTKSESLSPMLGRLVSVLYEAALPAGVAEEALNMVVAAVAGVYGYAYHGVHSQIGDNTNAEGPAPDVFIEFIPTPGDMTKH